MPHCHRSQFIIPIIYGFPPPEVEEPFSRGEVFLGGCTIGDDDPTHFCKQCVIKFDEKGRVTELTWDEKIGWEDEGGSTTDDE